MPEVTGIVNDPIRRKSYILKMAGSDAAEVFVFNMRKHFLKDDVLQLKSIPTLVTSSDTEDVIDATKAHYILADLEIEDVLCKDGKYLCPVTKENFTKQATLYPYDMMTMIPTHYLRNGEILLSPVHPRRMFRRNLVYPVNLIEIGDVTELETPVTLAIYKKGLFEARGRAPSPPEHIDIEPSSSHFQPIQDQGQEESASDTTTMSAESTSSLDSTYISGTLNFGKTTTAVRARCGLDVERSLDKAMTDPTNPDFSPWMASTGSTPPSRPASGQTDTSSRPTSAQSLPAQLGSPDSQGSPARPRSASPAKTGRKHSRKSSRDRTYQPKIRGFLTPVSPQSPIRSRTPLPNRSKRRSQRVNEDQEDEPSAKRQATSGEDNTTVNVSSDEHDSSALSEKEASVLIIKEVTKEQKKAAASPPVLIDLENDITPKEVEKSTSPSMDVDTSNEAASKGGNYKESTSSSDASVLTSVPTPPISTSSSRAGSMTTNQPGSNNVTMSSTGSLPPNPYIDPVPGPSCSGSSVSLHSNIPMDTDPKHVLIKASKDHVQVKILTFKAYNLDAIVRCFFEENIETDNPGDSLDETLEDVINSSDSSNSSRSSIMSVMTKFLSSTLQMFMRREETPENTSYQPTDEEMDSKDGEEGEKDEEEEENGGKGNAN